MRSMAGNPFKDTTMNSLEKLAVRTPVLGRALLTAFRAKSALRYYRGPMCNLVKWLYKSQEIGNFTYGLQALNRRYLASMIADVTNTAFASAMTYMQELEQDEELKKHVADATVKSDLAYLADKEVRFGRRVGWYVFARALKPRVVVETGVDKGLGACVLTAALKKNAREGHPGEYYGTDINPRAGYLLSGDYANYGRIIYGDSIQSLKKLNCEIDLFINDSDHSTDYEARKYKAIESKLSTRAIVLGDNSHCSEKLLEFSLATNRHFIFFQEKPFDHWYPGAGIGISFKR